MRILYYAASVRAWRNRQTQRTLNPFLIECGFKSRRPHQLKTRNAVFPVVVCNRAISHDLFLRELTALTAEVSIGASREVEFSVALLRGCSGLGRGQMAINRINMSLNTHKASI